MRPTTLRPTHAPGAAIARLRPLVALVVVCVNAWLLVHFHDRFWWAPDEGNYAHVAERILDGDVLHADVQDVHPGYVNFANAGALALFGRELVSMRYPLVLLGVAQSAIVFAVLSPVGLVAAGVGATAITALGFVQFMDPTAHWYALFLVVLLAGVLHATRPTARWRLDLVGALVMTTVLFRQLSGILVAMGVLVFLLLEASADARARDRGLPGPPAPGRAPWLARGLVAVMLLGLAGYLGRASDEVGWAFFGVWPALLLLWTGWAVRAPNGTVVAMLARLTRGGVLAALPLVGYHTVHGSLGAWYDDTLVTATRLPRMPFFDTMSYASHLADAVRSLASGDPQAMVNGAFWTILTFTTAVVGGLLLRQLAAAQGTDAGAMPPALPILAVFYAVVSVHYQILIYLTYTVGLSLVALVYLTRGARSLVLAAGLMLPVALHYHAGQPLSRGVAGAAEGRRTELVPSGQLQRVGLRVEASDVRLYAALLDLIRREVPPGEAILAVPSHAELYFLSGRRNPFRFFNTALGVRTPQELATVLDTLERRPPVLVFYDRADKYNTRESAAIMDRVRAVYQPLPAIGQFEIYRRPDGQVAARASAPSSVK